jgi:O-methyltransferase
MLSRGTDDILKRLGLFDAKRWIGQEVRGRGWLPWRSLIDEDAFGRRATDYVAALDGSDEPFGAYVEFGVSRGTSLARMAQTLAITGYKQTRLIGFDSFEGLPGSANAEADGWSAGEFKSTHAATRNYLRKQGVDMSRVTLVKGWFEDTLTEETAKRLDLRNVGVVMIDCDLYDAANDALRFVAPYLNRRAVVILDDWGDAERLGAPGEKEAFTEFLAARPEWASVPLPGYDETSRVFLLTRAA